MSKFDIKQKTFISLTLTVCIVLFVNVNIDGTIIVQMDQISVTTSGHHDHCWGNKIFDSLFLVALFSASCINSVTEANKKQLLFGKSPKCGCQKFKLLMKSIYKWFFSSFHIWPLY